jgi:hypothetical protein
MTAQLTNRAYPHVPAIPDPPTQQTVRLLWDRIYALEELLEQVTLDLEAATGTIEDLIDQVEDLDQVAHQALAQSGKLVSDTAPTEPEGVDDGLGAQGCAANNGTGHVAASEPLDPVTGGRIVCGTGVEFASLKAATVDLPTREANAEELVRRMIWHLQQKGFTAGRQRNPSGVISKDKLTFKVPGEPSYRAYDVFIALDDYTTTLQTHMGQVFPADYVADAGIAD